MAEPQRDLRGGPLRLHSDQSAGEAQRLRLEKLLDDVEMQLDHRQQPNWREIARTLLAGLRHCLKTTKSC